MLREANARISSLLRNIFNVYSLSQLIREPTRVTSVSNILIDLCITNSPEEVTKSGVIHLAISDHSVVFLTRKAYYDRNDHRTIETRQVKHFDSNKFLRDLNQTQWANVDLYFGPKDMWQESWKELFLSCVNKHAPLKLKRVHYKSEVLALLVVYCVEPEEEIFFKISQSLPII